MTGIVTNIQRFSIHDGDGIRTTVFLKGCPLDCFWCHNPETKDFAPQLEYNHTACTLCGACKAACPEGRHEFNAGRHFFNAGNCIRCFRCVAACMPKALKICGVEMSAEDVMDVVLKDKVFYGKTGGITISGGEPMAQPGFTFSLLKAAKKNQITSCVQTGGLFKSDYIKDLSEFCDRIMWDIKDTDPARHFKNTGACNNLILKNLETAADLMSGKIVIRGIILNGVNDTVEHVQNLCDIAREYGIKSVKLFKFHPFGGSKMQSLGACSTPHEDLVPSDEKMDSLNKLLNIKKRAFTRICG